MTALICLNDQNVTTTTIVEVLVNMHISRTSEWHSSRYSVWRPVTIGTA